LDAWENTIFYYPDPNLVNTNICYSSSAGFNVEDQCPTGQGCGTSHSCCKTGTAFIVLSKGENYANNTNAVPTFIISQQSDTYDDIPMYVSISEIRKDMCGELKIDTTTLPAATEDVYYSTTLLSTGGSSPTWDIASGTLPNSLSLSSSGIISGTVGIYGGPTGTLDPAGQCTIPYTFTARLSQTGFTSVTQNYTITVSPQTLNITTTTLPDAKLYADYSITMQGTGGKNSYTWSVVGQTVNTYGCTGGSYPITGSDTGMCLTSAGVLSNYNPGTATTPKLVGLYNFTVQISDGCTTATKAFALAIKYNDPTGGMGFTVRNNTGGSSYYKRNNEACTLYPSGAATNNPFLNVQPGDVFTFWNNSTCTNQRCTSQVLDMVFFSGLDINGNFCIRWTNNAAATCNFADDVPTDARYNCPYQ
jgi:hypothetical protein